MVLAKDGNSERIKVGEEFRANGGYYIMTSDPGFIYSLCDKQIGYCRKRKGKKIFNFVVKKTGEILIND